MLTILVIMVPGSVTLKTCIKVYRIKASSTNSTTIWQSFEQILLPGEQTSLWTTLLPSTAFGKTFTTIKAMENTLGLKVWQWLHDNSSMTEELVKLQVIIWATHLKRSWQSTSLIPTQVLNTQSLNSPTPLTTSMQADTSLSTFSQWTMLTNRSSPRMNLFMSELLALVPSQHHSLAGLLRKTMFVYLPLLKILDRSLWLNMYLCLRPSFKVQNLVLLFAQKISLKLTMKLQALV